MREALIAGYLRRKLACMEALEQFAKEERGASDIVAILLVVVILIGVASVFGDKLTEAVTAAFDNLLDFVK
ncbi:MAG: hypothetical protein IKV59_00270 [Lachnospiraceae bacterium]|nr:hypothetical protein [Lachnospiraceae bacterium]